MSEQPQQPFEVETVSTGPDGACVRNVYISPALAEAPERFFRERFDPSKLPIGKCDGCGREGRILGEPMPGVRFLCFECDQSAP